MERSLHRQLKERYGLEIGGRSEVTIGPFRVDALTPDGRLVEIQSSPLGLLQRKLEILLPNQEVDVIKPVVVSRRVIRRETVDGVDLGSRRSPKRGRLLDAFDDLVGLARLFPHPNLRIELLAVEIDEIRVARRRRPGYLVVDRVLREVVETIRLETARDLWSLLPDDLADRFTTLDLSRQIGRSLAFAQRVAYCLLHSGAAEVVAKLSNRRVYAKSSVSITGPAGRSEPIRLEPMGQAR
jgi:hypothetical protein